MSAAPSQPHPRPTVPSQLDPREEGRVWRQGSLGSRGTAHHLCFLQLGLWGGWLVGGRSFQSAGVRGRRQINERLAPLSQFLLLQEVPLVLQRNKGLVTLALAASLAT